MRSTFRPGEASFEKDRKNEEAGLYLPSPPPIPSYVPQPSLLPTTTSIPKTSILPLTVTPKYNPQMNPMSYYQRPPPWQSVPVHPYGLSGIEQMGHPIQNVWQQRNVMVQQTPTTFPPQTYVRSNQHRRSILPLKVHPKQNTTPPPSKQKESVGLKMEDGFVDANVFPEGLWNNILFETMEVRSRQEAVEKLLSQTQSISMSGTVTQEKAPNGMLEHVGVKPGGDEKKSVSMEKDHAMESLPTGLSTSPREQPSFEETPERIDASQKDDE